MKHQITFILGCTGCGKGRVGRELARRVCAEILSTDSMKVYRRMDIGTAKPTAEDREIVPHHLIDVVEPSQEFSVAQFAEQSDQAIAGIHQRGHRVLAVGGTALYIKALSEGLFEGPSADEAVRQRLHAEARADGTPELHKKLQAVDPVAAERIHPNDLRRIVRALEVHELTGRPISELQTQWGGQSPDYVVTFVGLRREREDQSARTNARVKRMIEQGLVAEVEALLAEDPPPGITARQALGYAEIIEHLEGKVSLAEAVENIKINTRRLSKAQRTWFKRFPDVFWIDLDRDTTVEQVVDELAAMEHMPWSKGPR